LLLLSAGAIASASAQISAQSPTPNPAAGGADKPRSIQVRSGLVLVPAIVTNSSGEHASGLTRENFAILKNGRPQPVGFFQHIEASAQRAIRPVTPPNVFTNAGEPKSQRLIIFVLDQLNSSLTEQDSAREQLAKFLSTSSSAFAVNREPLCLRSNSIPSLRPALIVLITFLVTANLALATQNITATSDVNGKSRPATAEITEPSTIRCTSAKAQAGNGVEPSCQVNAPNFSGKLDIGKQIRIEKPGYITLTCNGNPPSRCSAQIDP